MSGQSLHTVIHEPSQGVVLWDAQRPSQKLSRLPRIACEARLLHTRLPEVDHRNVELRTHFACCISIVLDCARNTRDGGVSFGLIPRPPQILIKRRLGDQYNSRFVFNQLGVRDDLLDVGFVLV